MASLSYDSNKLPLGKLSKEVISRGYQTLKDLGEVIEQKPGCIEKFSEYGDNRAQILNRLSNRYYTVIPHSFGRNTPPVIDTGPKLKKEIELIENLGDMALTTKIMSDTKAANADGIHQLDKQFDSLGLNEAVPRMSSLQFGQAGTLLTRTLLQSTNPLPSSRISRHTLQKPRARPITPSSLSRTFSVSLVLAKRTVGRKMVGINVPTIIVIFFGTGLGLPTLLVS